MPLEILNSIIQSLTPTVSLNDYSSRINLQLGFVLVTLTIVSLRRRAQLLSTVPVGLPLCTISGFEKKFNRLTGVANPFSSKQAKAMMVRYLDKPERDCVCVSANNALYT